MGFRKCAWRQRALVSKRKWPALLRSKLQSHPVYFSNTQETLNWEILLQRFLLHVIWWPLILVLPKFCLEGSLEFTIIPVSNILNPVSEAPSICVNNTVGHNKTPTRLKSVEEEYSFIWYTRVSRSPWQFWHPTYLWHGLTDQAHILGGQSRRL